MDLFSGVHQRTLLVLLVCSSLSVASGKESHPVLKCNSYADAEDRGREKLSRGRESPFLLQVTRTEVEDEIRFQYRGRFNILFQSRLGNDAVFINLPLTSGFEIGGQFLIRTVVIVSGNGSPHCYNAEEHNFGGRASIVSTYHLSL